MDIKEKLTEKSVLIIVTGIVVYFFLSMPGQLYSGEPGTTGANFLKIGVGPKYIAMGEASTAIADDVNSVFWNPAGLSSIKNHEISFLYNKWFEQINQQSFAYSYPYRKIGIFAVSITRLGMEPIQGYDGKGFKTDKVEASDIMFGLSYARRLVSSSGLNNYNIGFTVKWIKENLAGIYEDTIAFDLGLQYFGFPFLGNYMDGLSIGTALTNLGTGLKFDRDKTILPRTLKFGVGYTFNILDVPFKFASDLFIPKDNKISIGTGVEFKIRDILALRCGYKTNEPLGNGIRAGIGIKIRNIQLDYVYANYGYFGDTHRIGLFFKFGRSIEVTTQESGARSQEPEYLSAVILAPE